MKRNHPFFLEALLLFILTSFSTNANALLPYKYNWTKIKSEHFTVVVNKKHLAYGELVAIKAEQAFRALKSFSNKHPKRTFIIVDHTKGFSNGSATFFPYPIINLQPVAPAPSTSVGQYRDWLYELIVHEYTHILTFHNTRGLFTPLRWVFGSAVSPGYFMPSWYQEGIAVFTETHLSDGGRLRGSEYKAFKEELKEPSISIANEDSSGKYPFGSGPYIYGAWLNQQSFEQTGIEGAAKVHKTFSARFPYFINGGFKKNTKKSLYSEWRKAFGKNKVVTSTDKGFQGKLPQWHEPSQKLYFIQRDPYLFNELCSIDQNKKIECYLKKQSILQYQVYKNKIYYLSLELLKEEQDHHFFSLNTYDMDTKKTLKLSSNENIHAFDTLNDKITFVVANIDKQELKVSAVDNFKKAQSLLVSGVGDRISFPRFTDKNHITFSFKKTNSDELIQSINISSKKINNLEKAKHVVGIEKSPSGTLLLTENNGLKFLQKLGSPETKKQIPSNIQSLSLKSEDSFVTSQITHKGSYIFETDKIASTPQTPVDIKNQSPQKRAETPHLEQQAYSSFSRLLPHYIVPNALVSPYGFSGELLYGLSIGSQDPLGLNSYSLSASADTITEKVSASFNYTSRHTRFPISFSTGVYNEPLSSAIFRESTFASLGTSFSRSSSFNKNWNFSLQSIWNSTDLGAGQDAERLGIAMGIGLNQSTIRARELAPRKGYRIQIGVRHYLEGSQFYDYSQADVGIKLFFKSPLARTHRLIFGIDGEINNETLPIIFSSNSLNQPYRSTVSGSLALRGLPTGSLFATDSFAVAHLEYRFPLLNINWGPGLLPGFFKRIHGAFTADYGSIKGADFINNQLIDHSTPLYSAGAELVFEGKLFYHLPASLQIGVYKFLNSDVYSDSPEIFVGFGVTGLPY